jgi:hypothetical protein
VTVTIPAGSRTRCSGCSARVLRVDSAAGHTYFLDLEPDAQGTVALYHPRAGAAGPQLGMLLARVAEGADGDRYRLHSVTCSAQAFPRWRGGTPVRDLFDACRCRVDDCDGRVRVQDLLCGAHYGALNRWERLRLARAWNGGRPGRDFYETLRAIVALAARRRPVRRRAAAANRNQGRATA